MQIETVSTAKAHGGMLGVYKHESASTGTGMTFSVFLPPQAEQGGKLPVVVYLSGLTCTHANVTDKGEYRKVCAELGIVFVAPDTSPRGEGVLTYPDRFKSLSAFAPIVAPGQVPWGHKALGGYLGDDRATWRAHDAVALIEDGKRPAGAVLVDQGDADSFLVEQLRPELLVAACEAAGVDLTMRLQPGYDHSYNFISTFMDDHVRWHAARL